jgi:HEPN domain-containing protein
VVEFSETRKCIELEISSEKINTEYENNTVFYSHQNAPLLFKMCIIENSKIHFKTEHNHHLWRKAKIPHRLRRWSRYVI